MPTRMLPPSASVASSVGKCDAPMPNADQGEPGGRMLFK